MRSRRDQISVIVEETLLERGGYLSGVRMGAFPRAGDAVPSKPDIGSLVKQERTLNVIATSPRSSPFAAAAAQEELRNVQRAMVNLASGKTKQEIRRTIRGIKTGERLRKYVIEPVKGIFSDVVQKTFSAATRADAGTLRGKGYKV